VKIQKATNEIIGAIANSLISLPVDDDDNIFQLDVDEILAARRELVAA
jgi:hypothetical protein